MVQLGDSYSAGNGTGAYEERSCYRSPRNYGSQVAASLGATYVDRACSGGVVADILEPRDLGDASTKTATYSIDPATYPDQQAEWFRRAQTERLCGVPAQPDFSYRYTFVAGAGVGSLYTGTVSCQLVVRPQIDGVTPDTDLVFLTMGGNDLGFSTIVTNCLVAPRAVELPRDARLGPRRGADDDGAREGRPARRRRPIRWARRGLPAQLPVPRQHRELRHPRGRPDLRRRRRAQRPPALGDAIQARGIAELNAEPGADRYHFVGTVKQAWGGRVHGLDPHVVADNSKAWLVPVGTPGRDVAEFVHPIQPGWDTTAGALRAAVAG